jgi:hypothetical protein
MPISSCSSFDCSLRSSTCVSIPIANDSVQSVPLLCSTSDEIISAGSPIDTANFNVDRNSCPSICSSVSMSTSTSCSKSQSPTLDHIETQLQNDDESEISELSRGPDEDEHEENYNDNDNENDLHDQNDVNKNATNPTENEVPTNVHASHHLKLDIKTNTETQTTEPSKQDATSKKCTQNDLLNSPHTSFCSTSNSAIVPPHPLSLSHIAFYILKQFPINEYVSIQLLALEARKQYPQIYEQFTQNQMSTSSCKLTSIMNEIENTWSTALYPHKAVYVHEKDRKQWNTLLEKEKLKLQCSTNQRRLVKETTEFLFICIFSNDSARN